MNLPKWLKHLFQCECHCVNVKDYGAKGDGIADDTPAFVQALNAVPLNGVLCIPAGTYLLSSWAVFELNKEIRLLGLGGKWNTTIEGLPNEDFLDIRSSISVQGIGFESWRRPLEFTNNSAVLDYIQIEDCRFENCATAIRFSNNHPGSGCNDLLIRNCRLNTFSGIALTLDADVWRRATIADNYIADIHTSGVKTWARGIMIGSNDTEYAGERKHLVISGNTIGNISNDSNGETQGIIVYGTKAVITGNILFDISNAGADECEGIYTKCSYTNISNNILINAGRRQAMINIKGSDRSSPPTTPLGFAVVCTGNVLLGSLADTCGINVEQEDVLLASNFIEGMTQGGIQAALCNNIQVNNNTIRNCNPISIEMNRMGDRVAIMDNIIYKTGMAGNPGNAIQIANLAGSSAYDWKISGNLIAGVHDEGGKQSCIGLENKAGSILDSIQMENNTFADAPRGISLEGDPDPLTNVVIRANSFRSISFSKIVVHHTPAENLTLQDNTGFATLRAGETAIIPGNTSVKVAHGVDIPGGSNFDVSLYLLKIRISITPLNNMGNARRFWVSDIGVAIFKINTDADPETEARFAWRAEVI